MSPQLESPAHLHGFDCQPARVKCTRAAAAAAAADGVTIGCVLQQHTVCVCVEVPAWKERGAQ